MPICCPWFRAHIADAKSPGHGYTRISPWELTSVRVLDGGTVEITMSFSDNDWSHLYCANMMRFSVRVTVSDKLEVALTTSNTEGRSLR